MKNFALILGAIVFLTGAVNGKHVVTVGQEIPTLTEQKAEPQGADPVEIMKKFQTIEVQTGTWLAKPEMCEGALQKRKEFEQWGLFFVRGRTADLILKIDHKPGWFYYQYSLEHQRSGLVLSSGNVTAWDGPAACGQVANIIVNKLKKVRTTPEEEEKRKKEQEMNKKKEGEKADKEKEKPPAQP